MWAIPTGTSLVLKKNQVKSPSILSRTPNLVRIRQSGRTEIRGVTDRLAEHGKNKVSKNVKIPRNTISLITPKDIHNYTATLTTKRLYFNNYITRQGWKTEPKKEEKVEEKG